MVNRKVANSENNIKGHSPSSEKSEFDKK